MDRLRELLQSVWMKIVSALKNFENSSVFERIMRRYEGLSPKGQRAFLGLLKVGALMGVALMILGGPFWLLVKLNRIKTLERLEGDALVFQAEYEAQTRGYTPPAGWKPLAAGSASELASAFNEYLPNIGVPEEFGTLVASGESLNLTLKEISIRQATNILFQLEGLYPALRTQSFNARPNAGRRDIMDMEATFQFNPLFANQNGAPPPGDNMGIPEDNYGGSSDTTPSYPPPSSRPNIPSNNDSGGDNVDFQNDYVPPPPPPPGDYDELTPPDMVEDLAPPPPPPGFEEEG